MKNVQNLHLAMPRYQHCGHIDKVFAYVKSLPLNCALQISTLLGKLATLVAITAPNPSSELQLLGMRFYNPIPVGVVLSLPGKTKTSSEVRSVFFTSFSENKYYSMRHYHPC